MNPADYLWAVVVAPLGLGVLGFVEPCTVGSSLLFVKYLEGKERSAKMLETAVFTLTRALFIGGLGAVAAFVGSTFLSVQRWFWVLLGTVYVALGVLYVARKHGRFMRTLGPRLGRGRRARSAAVLGVVFGLNIPACATPLLTALMAANLGAGTISRGFLVMAIFGLALSLPLLGVVFWGRARGWLDRLAAFAERAPLVTGAVFILLGAWSIYFGFTA
ncbi:MAG: sulfite exporter TauE/SafE family protein [Gemmatimonadetes bacterium]|nr:sulfite exporter TauE/SafE family protein [Gemmatimonadota bacterium]